MPHFFFLRNVTINDPLQRFPLFTASHLYGDDNATPLTQSYPPAIRASLTGAAGVYDEKKAGPQCHHWRPQAASNALAYIITLRPPASLLDPWFLRNHDSIIRWEALPVQLGPQQR